MFRFTQAPSQQLIVLFIELKQLHSVTQNYQYDSEYRRDKIRPPQISLKILAKINHPEKMVRI